MEDGYIYFSTGRKCAALQQTTALKFECIHNVKKKLHEKEQKPALSSTSVLKINAV